MTTTPTATLTDLRPNPGAAPIGRMVIRQASFELKLLVRNGEQLLLAFIIPLVLLVGLSSVSWINLGPGSRVNIVTPGILALAVMSTAFTSRAIATGFDRRYGVLKLLGASPLPRWGLVAAKTLAIIVLEIVQVGAIVIVAFLLGWTPRGNPLAVVVLLIMGTAAFSTLGLALAGVLRAEATLAVANGIYLLLLFAGGTIVPIALMPGPMAVVAKLLPSGALGGGLRDVLVAGNSLSLLAVTVLLAWFVFGLAVAARTFRWD